MARCKGRCPACGERHILTRHHILPRRFFGNGKHNDNIVLLCRPCHNEVELRIPQYDVIATWKYFAIVAKFIKEKNRVT